MSEEEGEWEPWKNNPVIIYNSKDKIFGCKEHPDFRTQKNQGAGQHSKTHGCYLDGTKIKAKEETEETVETPEPVEEGPQESDEERALEERIAVIEGKQGKIEGREGVTDLLEQSSVRIAQDIAETATKVATNERLRFMYFITKKYHVFPIDMTFDEWIDANVTENLMKTWHVHVDFWTDLKKLDLEQLKIMRENKKNYKEMISRLTQSEKVLVD